MRYDTKQEPDERWCICHPEEQDRLWCGSHWAYRDQGAPVTSFSDRDQAERYAEKVLGDKR